MIFSNRSWHPPVRNAMNPSCPTMSVRTAAPIRGEKWFRSKRLPEPPAGDRHNLHRNRAGGPGRERPEQERSIPRNLPAGVRKIPRRGENRLSRRGTGVHVNPPASGNDGSCSSKGSKIPRSSLRGASIAGMTSSRVVFQPNSGREACIPCRSRVYFHQGGTFHDTGRKGHQHYSGAA